jgi:hypothetical protein
MMTRRFILSTIIPLCFATSVKAGMEDFYCPQLYVGADAEVRKMKFDNNYGGNIYKDEYPQGNVYLGIKGNEYIGIEAGWEASRTRRRQVFLPAGSILFGLPQKFEARYNVIVRLRGLHTSLIGFFPVWQNPDFKLIMAIGVTNLKIKLENTITEIANTPFAADIKFGSSKNVLRLMTGVQYMFNNCFGIRANVRWENTSKFKNIEPIRFLSNETVRTKDSIIYGLGVVFQF